MSRVGRCPYRPGERLICVDPGKTDLAKDQTYTVADVADLGPPSALVGLMEVPGELFHPSRFSRAPHDDANRADPFTDARTTRAFPIRRGLSAPHPEGANDPDPDPAEPDEGGRPGHGEGHRTTEDRHSVRQRRGERDMPKRGHEPTRGPKTRGASEHDLSKGRDAPEPSALTTVRNILADNRTLLPMFIIYEKPSDFPEHYVARLWWTLPEQHATNFTLRSRNIEEIRDLMEGLGLAKLMRNEEDDPVILETWL